MPKMGHQLVKFIYNTINKIFVDYPHMLSEAALGIVGNNRNHNHCIVNRRGFPFCYTTDPSKRWERCDCDTNCSSPQEVPTAPSVQCGNQAVEFARDRRVRPYSVFTKGGKCNKASCEVCEAERLQRERRDLNTDHSIVGGVNVKRGNVPWQVNLGGQSTMCGGTLVAMDVS